MLFLLSWRWLRCYAWCTLRVTFGAALRSDAIRDGASFVRLASYPRDYFGSPRLEPGFPPPRLGFHPTSEGYPIGDLEDFACSLVGRVATPTSVDASRLIRLFRAIWKDDKKLQYGAWLRAPQPKRPVAVRPRGHISVVDDAAAIPAPAPSAASGSPIAGDSVPAQSPASDAATRHAAGGTPPALVTSDAHATGGTPPAPATSDALPACTPAAVGQEQDMYDPMVHSATSDMLEDALSMPTDCALLVDIDGVVQSHGEDLVHDTIDAAADTLLREVAAFVLGCAPISVDTDAAVVSATSAAMTSASPTAPVLSRSAPACARRLPMPALPEHQEFDACRHCGAFDFPVHTACEGYVRSASPSVWPVVCLLPPGVPRTGLGSPPTRLRLSLYVNRGVARHEWLAAPMHGSLEGPRMGPGSLHLYLGVFLTTSGTSISGYSTHSLSLASP
ncbi:hypothetical protein V6N11_021631 [Hibiscus sabdariffa]|uniref:Uncharacterized protein n=1 Tax=Hibiscus sabdariffa TaxID=183260 RepID=A0ABR2PBG5_9ROSI